LISKKKKNGGDAHWKIASVFMRVKELFMLITMGAMIDGLQIRQIFTIQ